MNTLGFTILDAMQEPRLFQRLFTSASWYAWRAFLATLFGLPMSAEASELARRCTGRTVLPTVQARESWVIVGRRGGKSRIAALIAVFLACFRTYSLQPGETGVVMVLAVDRKQSRVLFKYIRALLQAVPELEDLIERETKESIDLKNGLSIEVHTSSYKSVRGRTVVAALLDEVAFWETSDDSANPDSEVLHALRPAMATIPNALLIAISSPYARRGELYRAYEDHFGQDGDPVLVWQADTQTMNPQVDPRVIQDAYAQDEAVADAEYGANFRRDVERFLSLDVIQACTTTDRELPPMRRGYTAFVDPSGGAHDSMTLAIAHCEGSRAVLDVVRERKAPFSPDDAVTEFARDLKRYGVSSVWGDKYAGEWPRERFRLHGITYKPSDKTKSDLYAGLLPLLTSQRATLLQHDVLRHQLKSLERRHSRHGKDTIDHPPRGRDDVANAVAGALVLAEQPVRVTIGAMWVEHLL